MSYLVFVRFIRYLFIWDIGLQARCSTHTISNAVWIDLHRMWRSVSHMPLRKTRLGILSTRSRSWFLSRFMEFYDVSLFFFQRDCFCHTSCLSRYLLPSFGSFLTEADQPPARVDSWRSKTMDKYKTLLQSIWWETPQRTHQRATFPSESILLMSTLRNISKSWGSVVLTTVVCLLSRLGSFGNTRRQLTQHARHLSGNFPFWIKDGPGADVRSRDRWRLIFVVSFLS